MENKQTKMVEANELYEKNIKLVPYVFNTSITKSNDVLKNKDDIMQEGYIALWKSCLKYDQSKNIKFCTFAVRQIYFSMLKYVYKIIHGKGKEIGFAIQNDDDKDLDMLNVYGEEDCNLLTIESKIYIEQILTNEPKVYMQIIELAQKGYTQQEIANEVHYSQCNISKMLKVIKQKIYSGLHD